MDDGDGGESIFSASCWRRGYGEREGLSCRPAPLVWVAVSVSCGVTHEIRSTPIELGSVGAWLSAVPFFSSASAPVRHFSIWRITRSLLAGGFVSVGFPSLRAGPGGSLAGRRHGHIRCW